MSSLNYTFLCHYSVEDILGIIGILFVYIFQYVGIWISMYIFGLWKKNSRTLTIWTQNLLSVSQRGQPLYHHAAMLFMITTIDLPTRQCFPNPHRKHTKWFEVTRQIQQRRVRALISYPRCASSCRGGCRKKMLHPSLWPSPASAASRLHFPPLH